MFRYDGALRFISVYMQSPLINGDGFESLTFHFDLFHFDLFHFDFIWSQVYETDLRNRREIEEAMEGVDTVIHTGGYWNLRSLYYLIS